MSMVNQHRHPLVVPAQVAPAFHGEILPKEFHPVAEKPKGKLAKFGYYAKKSSLISAPAIGGTGIMLTSSALEMVHRGIDTPLGVHLFGMSGLGLAFASLIVVFNSVGNTIVGDYSMVPWSSRKGNKELEEKPQEDIIAPFTDWDNVFSKHDNRTKLNQILKKKD